MRFSLLWSTIDSQNMGEFQPVIHEKSTIHKSEGSFFIGREGLRIPMRFFLEREGRISVAPVDDLFTFFSSLWSANGHVVGKVPRDESISLCGKGGYLAPMVLRSYYNGLSDEQLAILTPPKPSSKPPQLGWEPNCVQGVEDFALCLPGTIDFAQAHPTASRTHLLTSRTYYYDVETAPLHEADSSPIRSCQPRINEKVTSHSLIDGEPLYRTNRAEVEIDIVRFIISDLLSES